VVGIVLPSLQPFFLGGIVLELFVDEVSDFRRDLVSDDLLFEDLADGFIEVEASEAMLAFFEMCFKFTDVLLSKFLVEVFVQKFCSFFTRHHFALPPNKPLLLA